MAKELSQLDRIEHSLEEFRGTCRGRHEGIDARIDRLDRKSNGFTKAEGKANGEREVVSGAAKMLLGNPVKLVLAIAAMFGINGVWNRVERAQTHIETQQVVKDLTGETKKVAAEVREELAKRVTTPTDVLAAVKALEDRLYAGVPPAVVKAVVKEVVPAVGKLIEPILGPKFIQGKDKDRTKKP